MHEQCVVDFIDSVEVHGCKIQKDGHVLLERKLYRVERIARVDSSHYMLLSLQVKTIRLDSFGMMVIAPADVDTKASFRLISLNNASTITGVWTVREVDKCVLVVKY